MNAEKYESVNRGYITKGTMLLMVLMGLGLLSAVYRFAAGLGAATNLTDDHPWGIWIAFDVLCGVALAAGGFTTAAVAYLFGGEKYHALVRPAVLTALLGYVFVAIALLADLGLPWNIWHPIIYWPEHSAMFEVAWCVMLYLSVLVLEFAPPVFEKFGWKAAHSLWAKLVPVYTVLALSFFTYIMSHSVIWTAIALVVLTAIAIALPAAATSRPGTPVILIIAGVLFSTAHQSSLGTLFLLMQDRLSKLWWSPMLPVNFFLTAVAVGFAMVIFEGTLAAKAFGRPVEKEPLAGLGRMCAWVLWIYLVVRIIDATMQGGVAADLLSAKGLLFFLELLAGVLIPAIMLSSEVTRKSTWLLFTAASLVIFGVIFNRFNVVLGGMGLPAGAVRGGYFPSLMEILITAGIIAAVIFFYNIAVKTFPVFERIEPEGKKQ
ncbi:MAG: Ni/Fe-hydrogenase cytochrome b subunit [bacterium]|jgi:formate dehydrogenase iron-sulfur subunit